MADAETITRVDSFQKKLKAWRSASARRANHMAMLTLENEDELEAYETLAFVAFNKVMGCNARSLAEVSDKMDAARIEFGDSKDAVACDIPRWVWDTIHEDVKRLR